jgi:hypothetical protein
VESLAERIRAVLAELQQIQDELQAQPVPLETADEMAALNELKNYLDNLRHFLWAYFEAVGRDGAADIDSTLQNYRMKRVAEMLRALRAQIDDVDPTTAPEAPSFFQELMLAADTVYDKNLAQYKKKRES